ncbi:hypothetical protein RIF29_19464 [Crotalaria pallida]|uniref:RRM domain-containing protein n=1 Tax=Crotalaria pallida TaxID=3830 RepID=A0AAN9F7V1_CROPI
MRARERKSKYFFFKPKTTEYGAARPVLRAASTSYGRRNERSNNGLQGRIFKEAVTFYTSNIPEKTSTYDLWKFFQHQGKVIDVFAPAKRNKGGKRFAFVIFSGVINPKELERKLDNALTRAMHRWSPKVGRWRNRKKKEFEHTDDNTKSKWRLDVARIRVRTSALEQIISTTRIQINSKIFAIRLMEECFVEMRNVPQMNSVDDFVDNDSSSSDSETSSMPSLEELLSNVSGEGESEDEDGEVVPESEMAECFEGRRESDGPPMDGPIVVSGLEKEDVEREDEINSFDSMGQLALSPKKQMMRRKWTSRMGLTKGKEKIDLVDNKIDEDNEIEEEANQLWNIGVNLGINDRGQDVEIISRMMQMEQRDKEQLKKIRGAHQTGYILVTGKWEGSDEIFYIMDVYSPCELSGKRKLWVEIDNLKKSKQQEWAKLEVQGWGAYVFKEKLKSLKEGLKQWNRDKYGALDKEIRSQVKEINALDKIEEEQELSSQ